MNEIVTRPQGGAVALISDSEAQRLNAAYDQRQASNTRRTYKTALKHFQTWCAARGCEPIPIEPELLALYFDELADHKSLSTIRTYRAAIVDWHVQNNLDNPADDQAVRGVLKGISKRKARQRPKQAAPATGDDVATVLASLGNDPVSMRNKAMLAVARATLARRSELVGLNFDDIDRVDCVVSVFRQKTGETTDNGLTPAACEMLNDWLDWLEAQGVTSGAIFRKLHHTGSVLDRLNPASVNSIFKAAYEAAGLDSKGISGHSARVGTAQDLAVAGADVGAIAQAGGWTSTAMPVRYISKIEASKGAVATLLEV